RCEVARNALEVDTRTAVYGDERIGSATNDAIEQSRGVGCGDITFTHCWSSLRSGPRCSGCTDCDGREQKTTDAHRDRTEGRVEDRPCPTRQPWRPPRDCATRRLAGSYRLPRSQRGPRSMHKLDRQDILRGSI